jgi:Flp pilus assembly protein TadG
VEFAMVAPLFVMLIVGLLQFGRAYSVMISLEGAAREGARSLALGEPTATVETKTRSAAPAVVIDSVSQQKCTQAGGQAVVIAKKNITFSIPLVPTMTKTLEAQAAMRCGL